MFEGIKSTNVRCDISSVCPKALWEETDLQSGGAPRPGVFVSMSLCRLTYESGVGTRSRLTSSSAHQVQGGALSMRTSFPAAWKAGSFSSSGYESKCYLPRKGFPGQRPPPSHQHVSSFIAFVTRSPLVYFLLGTPARRQASEEQGSCRLC